MMFLGVDGGGSKTDFYLVAGDGTIASNCRTSGCSYFSVGMDGTEAVLRDGVNEVCARAAVATSDIQYAFFGLPGYGEWSSDIPALDRLPASILGHERYRCGNDMICGWAGSLGAQDGINVIAGTGSMTYGQNGRRHARCGGWGELFGDEGSGYWIAIEGLRSFGQMSDGRVSPTILHTMFASELQLCANLDVIGLIFNHWGRDRAKIASLAKLVVAAAEKGDECATGILCEAAHQLVGLVRATRRKLTFQDDQRVPVSYSGGLFESSYILNRFSNELQRGARPFALRVPSFAPGVGAAIYAAALSGITIRME